jgi:carboxylate-amine ligase
MDLRTVGVEEELLLVERATGHARAVSGAVMRYTEAHPGPDEHISTEMQREQLEIDTNPCTSLDELTREVRRRRLAASRVAKAIGFEVAALATAPLPVRPSITPYSRYRWMAREYRLTAEEHLICGCHVHVGVGSDEEGVAVLDRIRPWLPPLLAMSANSPFWQGRDTGYASFREQVSLRWPSAGPTALFGSAQAYHATVKTMVETGVLIDAGMIYFQTRLSRKYPTVEIRIGDVCLEAGSAVLLAALIRALVETAARQWQAGEPPMPVRAEVLRLAGWRASRSGLEEELVHPVTQRAVPALEVVRTLIDHVTPVLKEAGELATVNKLLDSLLARRNGAEQQRMIHRQRRRLRDVVAYAVARTTQF